MKSRRALAIVNGAVMSMAALSIFAASTGPSTPPGKTRTPCTWTRRCPPPPVPQPPTDTRKK